MLEECNIPDVAKGVQFEAHDLISRFQKVQAYVREESKENDTREIGQGRAPHQRSPTPDLRACNPLLYHIFALSEILTWYLNSTSTKAAVAAAPSLTSMMRILSTPKATRNDHWTWTDIHLAAQVQGVLYSLRILKQILQYVCTAQSDSDESRMHSMSHPEGLEKLYTTVCEALPSFEEWTPFNEERDDASTDVEQDEKRRRGGEEEAEGFKWTALDRLIQTLSADFKKDGSMKNTRKRTEDQDQDQDQAARRTKNPLQDIQSSNSIQDHEVKRLTTTTTTTTTTKQKVKKQKRDKTSPANLQSRTNPSSSSSSSKPPKAGRGGRGRSGTLYDVLADE